VTSSAIPQQGQNASMMQINLAPSAEFSPFSVIGIGIVNMIFLIFGLKSLATRPATNKTRSGPFMEMQQMGRTKVVA